MSGNKREYVKLQRHIARGNSEVTLGARYESGLKSVMILVPMGTPLSLSQGTSVAALQHDLLGQQHSSQLHHFTSLGQFHTEQSPQRSKTVSNTLPSRTRCPIEYYCASPLGTAGT